MLILGALWLMAGCGLALLLGAAIRRAEPSEEWTEFCRAHGLVDPADERIEA